MDARDKRRYKLDKSERIKLAVETTQKILSDNQFNTESLVDKDSESSVLHRVLNTKDYNPEVRDYVSLYLSNIVTVGRMLSPYYNQCTFMHEFYLVKNGLYFHMSNSNLDLSKFKSGSKDHEQMANLPVRMETQY